MKYIFRGRYRRNENMGVADNIKEALRYLFKGGI